MSTLHILMTASTESLKAVLAQYKQDDAILLAGDAGYLNHLLASQKVYALISDFESRGISLLEAHPVADKDWPELILSFAQQVTWP